MKPKKGFTMIEMLLVVLLLGILMTMSKSLFEQKNKTIFYSEICVNQIFGDITNFMNAGITSKGFYSGGFLVFPEYYIIRADKKLNKINFEYKLSDNTTGLRKDIFLTGIINNEYCRSNQHILKIVGNNYLEVMVKKGLQTKNNIKTFNITIDGKEQLTGDIALSLCDPESISCKDFSHYKIDSRIKNIVAKICKVFTGTDSTACKERNQ